MFSSGGAARYPRPAVLQARDGPPHEPGGRVRQGVRGDPRRQLPRGVRSPGESEPGQCGEEQISEYCCL